MGDYYFRFNYQKDFELQNMRSTANLKTDTVTILNIQDVDPRPLICLTLQCKFWCFIKLKQQLLSILLPLNYQ